MRKRIEEKLLLTIYSNELGDMVIVKSDDGVSAGGFRIDSVCLEDNSWQKGGSKESEPQSDYAVPAGLALVMDKPNVPKL